MKKRVIAVVAASAVTLCTAVTIAVGGTAGDPMLSKSYIDGAYTVQTISKAAEKITLRHDTLYQSAEETLKAKNDDYLTRGGLVTGDGTYQAAFSDLRVKEGDTVRIPIDLLDRLDAYGESEFGRRFDRSLFIVEAITGRLNGIKEGAHHG